MIESRPAKGQAYRTIHLSAAECAARVRKDLKAAFPGTKFSVRCSNFAGGSDVNVRYTGGPKTSLVKPIAEQYGQRGFDGSDDSTYYLDGALRLTPEGPVRYDYGGFVFVKREQTEEKIAEAAAMLKARYGIAEHIGLNDCDFSQPLLDLYCGSLRIAALNYLADPEGWR